MSKPLVLILCTGNSCRSQMAEGFLRHYQGDTYDVASAGTAPKPVIHPFAVRVMQEVGIDISNQKPEPMEAYLGHLPVRHLITVCDRASETCPRVWPGAYTRDFVPFDDPDHAKGTEEQVLGVFRRVRDEIREAMKTWRPSLPQQA